MKKKKIGIITLNGNGNYGNRLQNYALNKYLNKFYYTKTLWFTSDKLLSLKNGIKPYLFFLSKFKRVSSFCKFTNKLIKPLYIENISKVDFDYYVIGSDQVWNPYFPEVDDSMFGDFDNKGKNISYAASFGIDSVPDIRVDDLVRGINNVDVISVREDMGKTIISSLTGRNDVDVLVDPTMLLTVKEWDSIIKKPKHLKNKKYILNYFLGDLSDERFKQIKFIADKYECDIINILDKNSEFYNCGPSEFVYLEKHAFLICTDSFHSSVFALLYDRPFVIFEREEKDMNKMNSRLDTLISKFNLKNRKFLGSITDENLNHDYSDAYRILEIERQKSKDFLEKALDINK